MKTKQIPCYDCNGQGYTNVYLNDEGGCFGVSSKPCNRCGGTGILEVPMTNADRIRAMTDEELADILESFDSCSRCMKRGNNCFPMHNILEWLRQPQQED